ncbi:hypothetical protein, partial [Methylobacterium trifolii]|uniref:hypothetical protein n=1 Tax=Methylobacterium trifolii TaxID=1003092 RepID=UPI001EE0A49B
NGQYQSGNVITNGAAGYTVQATGDYNGDGTTDIVLQGGGSAVAWLIQNGQYAGGQGLGSTNGYAIV